MEIVYNELFIGKLEAKRRFSQRELNNKFINAKNGEFLIFEDLAGNTFYKVIKEKDRWCYHFIGRFIRYPKHWKKGE